MQNVHMNARKHAWNDGAAANVQPAVADQGSFALLFRSTQSNHISHLQCNVHVKKASYGETGTEQGGDDDGCFYYYQQQFSTLD